MARTFAFDPEQPVRRLAVNHAHLQSNCLWIQIRVGSDQLVDPTFVVDFTALDPLKEYIDETLHDLWPRGSLGNQPTPKDLARNFAEWAVENLQPGFPRGFRVLTVAVSEMPSVWAFYEVPQRPHNCPVPASGEPVDVANR